MTNQTIDDKYYLGKKILERGFRQWFLYLFKYINGSPWKELNIHKKMFKQVAQIINGDTTRLCMNLSPRSGKTSLATWLVVYSLTINPKSQIIYTSFNQDLLSQIAQQVAAIMQHPIYKALYGQSFTEESEEVDPIDDFWRDYLVQTTGKIKFSNRKIYTPQGGVVLFNSVGSAITGFGCGIKHAKGFSGILICFPYGEYVWTENGREKIGDIVKHKKKIKVWSVNTKTGVLELKPIVGWVKNPESDILEVSYMGKSFRCTPDHRVFTLNRGYVPAADLRIDDIPACLADSFDLGNAQSSFISNFRTADSSVHNQRQCLWGKFRAFPSKIINSISKTFKRTTRFNSQNSSDISVKISRNNFIRSGVPAYCNNIGSGKIRTRKNQRPNFNCVLHIFAFRTISKVFKSIIGRNRIKMSNFHSRRSFTNKRFHNSTMNTHTFHFGLFRRTKGVIASLQTKFQYFFRNNILLFSRFHNSAFTSDTPKVRHAVSSFVTHNGSPLLVRKVGHVKHSYCITVGDNHNMFVGKTQGFLVKNCDDPDKPTDIRSEKIREKTHAYYEETLLSRLNNSDTPVLIIQQRLHVDDMTGFLVSRYAFDVFKAPLLAEDGTCNLGNQYTEDRIKELQVNNYVFQAQYQQEPIMLGGGVFKHEWWQFYKDIEDTRYRKIFITADTAVKTKEWNDFTAIGVWGITIGNKLRLLDMVHGKFEIPELQATVLAIWDKWRNGIGNCRCTELRIEDKASGMQLIQQLRREGGIPIRPYTPEKDKYSRVSDAIPHIAAGNVELPQNENHPISRLLIAEADAFSGDDSHLHDDMIDMTTMAINVVYAKKGYF